MAVRSIRLHAELLERLDREADLREVSTNWLIIKILEEGVERLTPNLRVTNFAEIEMTA